jgi:diacylglycerol O-acyltransferase / wax synthase
MGSYYHYQRLSAQDASFLAFEGPNNHMHVCGTAIYEIGSLTNARGGVDIERIRRYIDTRLRLIPRYRQRLAYTPISGNPVWVDDESFNLGYHVRHTSLPRPGTERQLKRLAARIFSQQLDRGKPLWESWVVEGIEDNRFALITKIHHCMIDGAAGIDLSTALLRADPDDTLEEPNDWIPRPNPGPLDLLREETLRRVSTPIEIARSLREAMRDPHRARSELSEVFGAIWDMVGTGLQGAAATPLNLAVGPHRRLDWFHHDLSDLKLVKNRLGGTLNDVVLAAVAGGMARFLENRRVNLERLDYRAAVPVSMRTAAEHGRMGNRVSAWLMSLPLHERDPRRRLARVQEMTANLKRSKQAIAAERLLQLLDLAGSWTLLSLGVQLTGRLNPYNLVVTNVRGPDVPLYLLSAKMVEPYPAMPLFENQGLGIALVSYLGEMFWGFTADWDMVPDLHELVQAVRGSIRELYEAAATAPIEVQASNAPVTKPAKPRRPRAPRPSANGSERLHAEPM